MSLIKIQQRANRLGLYVPGRGTAANPNTVFFLPGISGAQLDDMVRKQLASVGITKESDVQSVMDKAEADYELRCKIEEAKK